MFFRLLILFTVVPLVELWLLLWIGSRTGLVFTVSLVLATGILGAALARQQGWQAWRGIHEQLARGQMPTSALVDGLMILTAGTLLITPGVLTDLVGFSLLVHPLRSLLKRRVATWLKSRTDVHINTSHSEDIPETQSSNQSPVIDAEFTRHPSESD